MTIRCWEERKVGEKNGHNKKRKKIIGGEGWKGGKGNVHGLHLLLNLKKGYEGIPSFVKLLII